MNPKFDTINQNKKEIWKKEVKQYFKQEDQNSNTQKRENIRNFTIIK